MSRQPSRTSLLCPNCRRLISSDEPICPHCGIRKPGSGFKNNALVKGLADGDQVVMAIIGINVVMFVVSLLVSGQGVSTRFSLFSFLSPSNNAMLYLGASGTIPIDRFGRVWTLISANWLHGGLMHLLFNMMALRNLAPFVIREYGTYRMAVIYIFGGIVSYAVSYAAGVSFTIGASGAVCALVGAALFFGKSRGGVYGNAVYKQVSGWILTMAVIGFLLPGINNWAHGGGVVAGAGIAWGLGYLERKRERQTDKSLAFISVLLTLGTLLWAIGTTAQAYLT